MLKLSNAKLENGGGILLKGNASADVRQWIIAQGGRWDGKALAFRFDVKKVPTPIQELLDTQKSLDPNDAKRVMAKYASVETDTSLQVRRGDDVVAVDDHTALKPGDTITPKNNPGKFETKPKSAFSKVTGKVTPIRRQYLDLKAQYPDALLAFRLGDFYEFFDEDAEIVSRELDLTLTGRTYGRSPSKVPMCGFPYIRLEENVAKLLERDYYVAVAEQVGEPTGSRPVEREVVRVAKSSVAQDVSVPTITNDGWVVGDDCILKQRGNAHVVQIVDVYHVNIRMDDTGKIVENVHVFNLLARQWGVGPTHDDGAVPRWVLDGLKALRDNGKAKLRDRVQTTNLAHRWETLPRLASWLDGVDEVEYTCALELLGEKEPTFATGKSCHEPRWWYDGQWFNAENMPTPPTDTPTPEPETPQPKRLSQKQVNKLPAKFRGWADKEIKNAEKREIPGQLNTDKRRRQYRSNLDKAKHHRIMAHAYRKLADLWESSRLWDVEWSPLEYITTKKIAEIVQRWPQLEAHVALELDDAHMTPERYALIREAWESLTSDMPEYNPEGMIRLREMELADRGIDQYFPTPRNIAETMVRAANLPANARVLEPSAGAGHILDVLTEMHPDATTEALEVNPSLVDILRDKGYFALNRDFLNHEVSVLYDAVIMNPPFRAVVDIGRQDMAHIRHAYKFLKPGGRLVALAAQSIETSISDRDTQHRMWLNDHNAQIDELAEGAFKDSDNPTPIHIVRIIIEKPE